MESAACQHATLQPGERCPGCKTPYGLLAARGALTQAAAPAPQPAPQPFGERLRQAWLTHPVRGFFAHREQLALFNQLHALLRAGVGVPTMFAEIQKYASDARSRAALGEVARRIEGGARLTDALRVSGLPLDDVTLELMGAAEETGALEPMLARTVTRLEETQRLRWSVVTSSAYPLYLIAGFVFVGPLTSLAGAISAQNGGTSDLGVVYLRALAHNLGQVSLIAGAAFFAPLLIQALGLQRGWEALRLRLPGIGALYRNLYLARFADTFAASLGAGLEAGKVLALSVRATGSALLRPLEPRLVQILRDGGTFVDALTPLGIFQGPELGTVAIGEQTGELDAQMARVATGAWEAVLRNVKITTYAALGVVVILAMAAIVGQIFGSVTGPIRAYMQLAGEGPG